MNRIVILTLTYNRPENLKQLFETLQKQTDKDFIWMIVDDGSPQDLLPIVSEMKGKADYQIDYYRKENGGKSSAINYAFDKLSQQDFALIIDDDEYLNPNAIDVVRASVDKYSESNVGEINFSRYDMNGNVLAHPLFSEDFTMSAQEHLKKGYFSGGYVGYFMSKVGNKRFPLYKGEKYIAPSVLMMIVGQISDIVWSHHAIGYTEFLEGGLTMRGRKLRLVSPKSMATHALLILSGDCGLKNRIKYSTLYYAYLKYNGIKDFEIPECKKRIFLSAITGLTGWCLSQYWKSKFKE